MFIFKCRFRCYLLSFLMFHRLNCRIPGPLISIRITSIVFWPVLQRMSPKAGGTMWARYSAIAPFHLPCVSKCSPLESNPNAKTLVRLQARDRTQQQGEERYGSNEFTWTSAFNLFSGTKQGWFATAVTNLHWWTNETGQEAKMLSSCSASLIASWTVGRDKSYFLQKCLTSSLQFT